MQSRKSSLLYEFKSRSTLHKENRNNIKGITMKEEWIDDFINNIEYICTPKEILPYHHKNQRFAKL